MFQTAVQTPHSQNHVHYLPLSLPLPPPILSRLGPPAPTPMAGIGPFCATPAPLPTLCAVHHHTQLAQLLSSSCLSPSLLSLKLVLCLSVTDAFGHDPSNHSAHCHQSDLYKHLAQWRKLSADVCDLGKFLNLSFLICKWRLITVFLTWAF